MCTRCELTEFNGDDKLFSFRGKFKTFVHDISDLTKVNNLTHLLGHFKGFASEMVSELTITKEDYEVAL